ncbi:MAG: EamA family transporter [Rudaea sp.]
MNFSPYLLLAVSISTATGGQILLKRGMASKPGFRLTGILQLATDWNIIAGFLFYGLSLLVYFKVLESVPLSFAFPTISIGYALVVILSSALFREPVSTARWLAVVLICFGVALVGLAAW